jgi:filamentous hemagglutinin family protein
MKKTINLIWNQVLSVCVIVEETSGGRGKGLINKNVVATLALCSCLNVYASPDGGQIVTGAGSITQSGATTTINQASQSLSLNWKNFNIAPTETVNFVQPSASAVAVNRIFDTNGTQILGQLNANGQVYLINPNGILFGQGAQVNVGALVASTLDINDASLNGTSRTFNGNGTGSIVNQGTINTASGGYAALLGNTVSNQGTITAPLGTVALGAGSSATLTFENNSLLKMQVDQSVLSSLSENGGLIRADGGRVLMSAGAKDTLLASVVNNTGVIEAHTVQELNGTIILLGGMTAGTANVSGTLDASAPNGGNGGFIETSAANVKIADDVKVTTAAPVGNTGTWLIDPTDYTIAAVDPGNGSYMSNATLESSLNSTDVTIETILAGTGNGDIHVNDPVSWAANKLTLSAHGDININADLDVTSTASLALNYGQGAVELANTSQITTTNAAVNLPAGTTNFTTTQGSDGIVKTFTVISELGLAGSATAADLQGMAGGLTTNYALGDNIDAAATSGWGVAGSAGFAPILGFTGTLDGLGHTVNGLFMDKGATGSIGLIGSAGVGSVIRNIGLVGGSVSGGASTGPLVGSNATGTVHNSYATGINVIGAAGTGGLVGSNTYGNISDSYATGDVSNGVAAGAGGLLGSNTYGNISNSYATGTIDGGAASGGLVGSSTEGDISNSYATGDVNGAAGTGGLVGSNTTGNIIDSYATGAVNNLAGVTNIGAASIGGLLGIGTGGDITNSYATGSVTGGAGAGGLVGDITTGIISNSYAFGDVIGGAGTGGLVGTFTTGAITNTYATGSVHGDAGTGGLVGVGTGGIITNSYATGEITGVGASRGGLIGSSPAAHVGSFWNTETTGYSTSAGTGVTGKTTAEMKDPAIFIAESWDNTSIWTLNIDDNYPLLTSLLNNVATVTANNRTATYKGTEYTSGYNSTTEMAPGFTGPLTGALSFSGTSQTAINVGNYVITPGGQTYGVTDNPQNSVIFVNGTLEVTKKALTITGMAATNRAYDGGTVAALTGGLLDTGITGETLTFANQTGAFSDKNVGTRAVSVINTTLVGDGTNGAGLASNYSLTAQPTVVAADITAKALTITGIAATSRAYDGGTVAALTGGLLDTGITGETLTFTGQTGTFADKNAANGIAVTVANTTLVSGSGMASNYSLTQPTASAANITTKALVITGMVATNKTYDGSTVAALTGGLLDTGIAGEALTFTGQTGTFADKNVGNGIAVTVTDIILVSGTGGFASNYSLTAQPAGLTADITASTVTPTTPVELIVVQNVITQLMSNAISLAGSPSEAGNPSTTITVISGDNDTMSIGNEGTLLKIINGGIRLPTNQFDLMEEKDV